MTIRQLNPMLAAALALPLTVAAAIVPVSSSSADPVHQPAGVGQPGSIADVDRTIEIQLGENFFEPQQISVRSGETIRFVVENKGELLHEFNIGTAAMHAAHQDEMKMMMEYGMLTPTRINRQMMRTDRSEMENTMDMDVHNDPNSVLVEPNDTKLIIWTFTENAELEFACNIPGHYQTGMVGRFVFDH